MFVGEYSHALDAKGRLTIPARFRDELENGLFITKGYEQCLAGFALSEWTALAGRAAKMPLASRSARSYSRLVFGGACEAVPDKMGRVLIPAFLREYAGIEEEAVIVGVNTYIEFWNPERWRQMLERDAQNLDMILSDVAQMGV